MSRAAKGADCKSAGYAFVGSSPTSPTIFSSLMNFRRIKERLAWSHSPLINGTMGKPMSFTGKTAVVTGSTSGIGLAIARAFAAGGANVVINGLGDAAAIEQVRAGIESEFGVKCIYSPANMLEASQIRQMITDSESAFGSVDILVNNAGIQHVAPIDEFPDDKFDAIIRMSAFYAIKAALPGMKVRGFGRIINIASAHALVASPFKSAYVAAKHGIAGMTKSVALEVAKQHITVNAIAPGYVWTPLVAAQIPDTMKARNMTEDQVKNDVMLAAQPTKQFVTVDEVASLALYLASDAAKSVTGAVMSIDGGWTAQ
jgi:3-hydroxybutyrate dehydrogenase